MLLYHKEEIQHACLILDKYPLITEESQCDENEFECMDGICNKDYNCDGKIIIYMAY